MCWAVMEEEELPLVGVVPGGGPLSEGLPKPQPHSSHDRMESPVPKPSGQLDSLSGNLESEPRDTT